MGKRKKNATKPIIDNDMVFASNRIFSWSLFIVKIIYFFQFLLPSEDKNKIGES